MTWAVTEPREGEYDFSQIDAWAAEGKAKGKQVAYSIGIVSDAPDWIKTRYKTFPYTFGYNGLTRDLVRPWDCRTEMVRYIKALATHIDGQFDYVVLGGIGILNESYLPPPDKYGEPDAATELAHWQDSTNAVINAWCGTAKVTPCIFAAAVPVIPNYGPSKDALDKLCRDAAAKYPLIGFANFGANDHMSIDYPPNKLVSDFSATHITGFQFSTEARECAGDVG